MDEIAKTEVRNYLSAAGFFLLAAEFLLMLITHTDSTFTLVMENSLIFVLGIGLLIVATTLIIMRKRDMLSLLFFMMGFHQIFCSFNPYGLWNAIFLGFLLLTALVTLSSKEKQKWLLFLIPAIWFLFSMITTIIRCDLSILITIIVISLGILTALSLYFSFCCASERISLPGRKFLTADEETDFKASGSVLGYMIIALLSGGYALHYIVGDALLPLETFVVVEHLCGIMMILVTILLLCIGKMRFTPIMFLLFGLTSLLCVYAQGLMFIGIGILFIVIGLFAMLRKESRILPGIMIVVYGCTAFFSAYAAETMVSVPVVSFILNAVPCLIAVYLSFVVYSQRKLPKF